LLQEGLDLRSSRFSAKEGYDGVGVEDGQRPLVLPASSRRA
jgi:hypothetical protein